MELKSLVQSLAIVFEPPSTLLNSVGIRKLIAVSKAVVFLEVDLVFDGQTEYHCVKVLAN